jgi:hypothetical protein
MHDVPVGEGKVLHVMTAERLIRELFKTNRVTTDLSDDPTALLLVSGNLKQQLDTKVSYLFVVEQLPELIKSLEDRSKLTLGLTESHKEVLRRTYSALKEQGFFTSN